MKSCGGIFSCLSLLFLNLIAHSSISLKGASCSPRRKIDLGGLLLSVPPQPTHMALEIIVHGQICPSPMAFDGFSIELWHLRPTLARRQGRTSQVKLMDLPGSGQHNWVPGDSHCPSQQDVGHMWQVTLKGESNKAVP